MIVTIATPAIEVIVAANIVKVRYKLVSTGERDALVRVNGQGLTSTRHFPFPPSHRNNGGVTGFIDI